MIDPEYAATYNNVKKLFDATKYWGAGENIGLLGAKGLATTTRDVITAAGSTEKAVSKATIISSSFGSGGSSGDDSVDEGTGKKLTNGAKMTTDEALDAASDFLGPGYKDMGNGRFVSADGTRQVRMGDSDILGQHGGGPHMNFEKLVPNPAKPGQMIPDPSQNIHIYLTD